MTKRSSVQHAVLTTSGKDAVGSDARVSDYLSRCQANIEEKYTAKLGDRYCTMTLLSADAEQMKVMIVNHLRELDGLFPVLHMAEPEVDDPTHDYIMTLYSFDGRDIVSTLTTTLERLEVDIVGMAACRYSAPEAGIPMFALHVKLALPDEFSMRRLLGEIQTLESESAWDIDLRPYHRQRVCEHSSETRPFPPSRGLRAGTPHLN